MTEEKNSGKWLALIAIILGAFVAVLNNSLINVALPEMVNVFGSSTDVIQWVLTGYMLANAVVIPMSGFLGDRFGYKKVFVVSLAGFTIGSLLCGLAWSDSSLIGFRIIQGLAGGLISPLSMAIIYSIMPRHQIGTALGIWGIAAMAAPAIGPTASGYLIQYLNWRFLFFICVPIGAFAVLMGVLLLKETPKREGTTFDWQGAVLSIIFFGSLLLALSKGNSEGWTSFFIVSLFFVSVFSMLLLIWVETGKQQPLLDLRFFKNPIFTLSVICSSLVMMGLYGGTFLTPLYLQNVQVLTPIQTGLVMMPQSVAMALMMPVSGKLFDKIGVVPLAFTGLILMGTTTFELHRLTIDTPNHWLDFVLTLRGLGIGLCMMPLTTVGMNAVPKEAVGRASSVSNVIRQVAGTMAIAILTMLMMNRQVFHGNEISENIQIGSFQASQLLSQLTTGYYQMGADLSTSSAGATYILFGWIQKEALSRSIADTFMASSLPLFIC
ncbi:MAG TPA: DHA2 family efflux MFS transporter permease subunit, partial [Bacillota bacterium]|nr:DHA2 family efflux MFS transporter permease subunit [Bacillota bacterium]